MNNREKKRNLNLHRIIKNDILGGYGATKRLENRASGFVPHWVDRKA
jgi:hypothetical protein